MQFFSLKNIFFINNFNFFIKYTGNKLPSLGSIIKKRVPSATIILQHAVQENPDYQVEIDSLISSLKLGESIGVPNLSNSPISNMSIGYFYKDVLFGKSGDAIILHPLESLKEPEDSIEKDTMPSPIKLKLHQKPKETETGL